MKYRAEVDGLRAVAILPVVLYHVGLKAFSGGFVGVDVFFVISGYLITSLILLEKREGRFSLTGFYQRRIRRIFPALFVMLAVSYPIAWILLGPVTMGEFSGSFAAAAASVANIYFLGVSGYFATAAELKPLLHTWSLSVEEQFYLVFPAAVLLTWRLGPRVQVVLFAIAAAVSIALAQWQLVAGDAASAFFLLQTRFWELLAGVLAAYWLASSRGQQLFHGGRFRHLAILGLGLIAVAVFSFTADTPFPGLAALLPCLGAALVILFATPRSLAAIVLGWRPVVFVGLISYSLYLWHFPLLVFTRLAGGANSLPLLLAACLLSGVIAWLSWRYIERPVRALPPQPPVRLFGWAAAGLAILVVLGLAGLMSDGYRGFYLAHRVDPATRRNYELYQPLPENLPLPDTDCQFATRSFDQQFAARFEDCARRYGKGVLVLGDSHSANIYNALRDTGQYPFVALVWRSGCRPFKSKATCPYDTAIPFLASQAASVSQVVFHISGSHMILDHLGKDDSPAAFIPGAGATLALDDAKAAADYVASLPKGPDIVWLGPFPEARVDMLNPENFSPERLLFNPVSLDIFPKLDQALKAETRGRSEFRYVSLVDALHIGRDSLMIGDCITFSDQDHMSRCGEALFGPAIAATLTAPP